MLFEQGLSYFSSEYGITLSSISSFIIIIVSLIYFNKNIFRFPFFLFLIVIIIYWTYSLFNCLYSNSMYDGIYSVIQGFYYILLTVSLYILINLSKQKITTIIRFSGISSFLILLYFTFYQQYTGKLIRSPDFVGKFSFSPFEDYNMFILMLFFSVLFTFYDKKVNLKSLFLFLSMVLITITLAFLVGSRRSIVLYTPIVLLYLFKNISRTKLFISVLIIPVFFILLISTLNKVNINDKNYKSLETYINRSLSFFTDTSSATDSRTERWSHVTNKFENSNLMFFVTGFGQRSFFHDRNFIRSDGSKDNPHNFLLTALYEGGLPKVFIICVLLFILLIYLNESKLKIKIFYIIFILLYLITVSMSGSEFFTSKHIYFYFALIASSVTSKKYFSFKNIY